MPQPPQDELLSAYLDGEVAGDEQALVEQWLASDPQFRRQHEELRALRGVMESLPRFTLPADFSARVLREAEERVLAGASARGPLPVVAASVMASPVLNGKAPHPALQPAAQAASLQTVPWRERLRRPIAWSLVTIAAALLITFFNPPTPEDESAALSGSGPSNFEGVKSPGDLVISAPPDGTGTPSDTADSTGKNRPGGEVPPGLADLKIRVTRDGFAADGLLVVHCDVSLNGSRAGAFRDLLRQQKIGWETDDDPVEVPANDGSARPQHVQVVYVEASAKQIERVLAGLNAQAAAFPNVALVPVPGAAWQRNWQAQYERHGHPGQTADAEPSAPPKSPSNGVRKGKPIKGNALDAQPGSEPTSKEPAAKESAAPAGRAWSIAVPAGRVASDTDPSAAVPDGGSDAVATQQEAELAMLRVLFVLRVLGGDTSVEPSPDK